MDIEQSVREAVEAAIDSGQTPGAVVVIGRGDDIALHLAIGDRMVVPRHRPMQQDTVFDLASLTKPMATAPAILQLAERGELLLSDPACRYLPEFTGGGRENATILHLLTHTAGLAAHRDYLQQFGDQMPAEERRPRVIADICSTKLEYRPGTEIIYTCLGYVLLASIVQKVAGIPLDDYAREHIYRPLGMDDTCFNPGAELRKRCAATEQLDDDELLVGTVHDETARFLNGVGGNAGLFGTATDVSKFVRAILNGGEYKGTRILSGASVARMTSPQWELPAGARGIGWDIHSPLSPQLCGDLLPPGGFGHSGYTGTSIWVHPETGVFTIILTNRVHLGRDKSISRLRGRVANIAAGGLIDRKLQVTWTRPQPVKPGIELLADSGFDELRGQRIGIICNDTAVDNNRRHLLDILRRANGVSVGALFGPEHGFAGTVAEGRPVQSDTHETGIPVYSLYGEHRAPTQEMLDGLDALVYDIFDVGVRFYTYTTTMALCMQSAAKAGVRFIILDRPNPINGRTVQGPVLDMPFDRLPAWHLIPLRHGMTSGELALWSNEEYDIGCDLQVIECDGWSRDMWFDETGMPWLNPSPNIRNFKQAILYPAIGTLEATNLSVGRGTDTPFEIFGAPWIDGGRLAHRLNALDIPQLSFTPIEFTPDTSKFAGQACSGVYIMLHDRRTFATAAAAVRIARLLREIWYEIFEYRKLRHLLGSERAVDMIGEMAPTDEIIGSWRDEVQEFRNRRERYLIY